MNIKLKRAYDLYNISDGKRVLVDRLWPRGIKKENLKADLWLKEIAPSSELRKWFNHEDEKWTLFKERYFAELDNNKEEVNKLIKLAKEGDITLIFSATNIEHNQAVALKEYLLKH
jgi:uncharacterized protein YeaO (DUF488 family)